MRINEIEYNIRGKKVRVAKLKDLEPNDILIFWLKGANEAELEAFYKQLKATGIMPCQFMVLPDSVKMAKFEPAGDYLIHRIWRFIKKLFGGK